MSTPILTPAQVALTIKANNALWRSSTKAQRVVLIARDVLARLRAGQYDAQSGTYSDVNTDYDAPRSLQKAILAKQASCTCCARGALFFSHVVFRNKVDVINGCGLGRFGASSNQDNAGLDRVFSRKQQHLIEAAFEGWGDREQSMYQADNDQGCPAALAFHNRYGSSKARLRAIANNVIRNEGVFVLPIR